VPGNASGGLEGVALKGLTVDFHEPGFVATLNGENQQPFWFEMSPEQQQRAGSPWGPANPQALNRYAYVQNNLLKWTDPSGHAVPCVVEGCRTRDDISGWSDTQKAVARVACWFLGCEVDDNSNQLLGPTPDQQLVGMMPAATISGGFRHAWIKRDLFRELSQLVGEADFKKFVAALDKGIVPPDGRSGIKILNEVVNGYTHELKIGGSAQRLLGRIDEYGVLVFDKFVRGGVHK
jgi:hypothetical protein